MIRREVQHQLHSPKKIAILTHSIPHFEVPLYRAIASCPDLELTVFYTKEIGVREDFDPLYNRPIQWGVPLLEGYSSQLLKNPLQIIGALRRERFDAVIVYGYADWVKMLAILSCYLYRVPLIFRGTATLLDRRGPFKQAAKDIWLTILFKLFTGFLVGGSRNKEYFSHYGVRDEQMFLVPFTVDVERFTRLVEQQRPQREDIRKSLGIQVSTVILFVGTLIPKKGPHVLLTAFRVLAEELDDVCLVLAGDGVLMGELKQYIYRYHLDDRVIFLGFVSQKELPSIYLASDFAVFPSLYDTWARAVNEAMACGLPVIATRKVGASGDIIRDGINGFVVKEGDIDDLAAKMRLLVIDRELRARMGEASKKIIAGWTYEAAIPNVIQSIEYASMFRRRERVA